MGIRYDLTMDREDSYKIDWIDKKPTMNSMQNFLKAYKDMEFMSTSGKSSQYVECGKDLKKVLKKIFGEEYKVELNIGHFYFSGFISKDNKYCYFSIEDLRDSKSCFDDILFRSARDNKDFTGGSNHYCSCEEFENSVKFLLERGF